MPRSGTRLRRVYDLLFERSGELVDVRHLFPLHRNRSAKINLAIEQLEVTHGLSIDRVPGCDRRTRYRLVEAS